MATASDIRKNKAKLLKDQINLLKHIEASTYSLYRLLLTSGKEEVLYTFPQEVLLKYPAAHRTLTRTFLKNIGSEIGKHYRHLIKEKGKRGGTVGGAFSRSKTLTPAARSFFVRNLRQGDRILPASAGGLTNSNNFTKFLGAVWRDHATDPRYKVSVAETERSGILKKDGTGSSSLRRFPVEDVKSLSVEIKRAVDSDYGTNGGDADHYREIIKSIDGGYIYMPTNAQFVAGPFNPWAFPHINGSKLQVSMLNPLPADLSEPQQVLNSQIVGAQTTAFDSVYKK